MARLTLQVRRPQGHGGKGFSAGTKPKPARWLFGIGMVATMLAGCGGSPTDLFAVGAQAIGQQSVAASSLEVPGRLIVKLSDRVSASTVAQSIGAQTVSSVPDLGMSVLSLPGGLDPEQAMARLAGQDGVEFAEPDYRFHADLVPNNPDFPQQWGLDAIDAPAAWNYTIGSPNVIVAVVDTGVDLTHPDLRSALLPGKSFTGTSGPLDDNGHGTHVCGIIAATMNSGIGTVGVAPGVRILPVKVLDAQGNSDGASIIAGLTYAADHGARIINLSVGGPGGSKALQSAIEYVQAKGCLVVAAMGNNGNENYPQGQNMQIYPAAYPGVLAVGATSEDGSRATFSNFGSWISVSAPGDGIYSTMPDYPVTQSGSSGGGLGYGYMSGTSMATPFVSGVAALVASVYPQMPAQLIKQRIEDSAKPVAPQGFDEFFGYGDVDALRAISGS